MSRELIQGQIQVQVVSFLLEEFVMYWGGYRESFLNTNTTSAVLTFLVAQRYGAGDFVGGTVALAAGVGAIATNAYRNLLEAANQPVEDVSSTTPENLVADMVEVHRQQV